MYISKHLTTEHTIRPLLPAEAALGRQIFTENASSTAEDTVLIVTTPEMWEQEAAIWFETAKQLQLPVELLVLSDMTRSGEEPPQEVVERASAASLVILQTWFSLTHTAAGKAGSSNNGRTISLPGATHELIMRTLTVPYTNVRSLGEELKSKLEKTTTLKIKSATGTDLTTEVRSTAVINDSGYILPGESGNLPGGEVFFAPRPSTTNGTLVIDGSIADDTLDAPITVTIVDGVATAMSGGAAAARLWEKLSEFGIPGKTVAEVGIGTNAAAHICENLLEAEKAYGTVHVAFGNSSAIGGDIDVPIHIDGLVAQPTVYADGVPILTDRTFSLNV